MMKKHLLQLLAFTVLTLVAAVSRADAPAAGQWAKFSIAGLETWVYTPVGYLASQPASLMVNLHGCSQKSSDLMNEGNWESAADRYNTVVALPSVPNGGVILGCWDYYGFDQTQSNKDNGPLLGLIQALEGARSPWKIDPSHVSISGLSSGSTEAMLMACLHPDVFSGIGLASGPVVGTDISEISKPRISVANAAAFCERLAGDRAGSFATQVASIIFDDADPLVNPLHSHLSKAVLSQIYQATTESNFDLSTLQGSNKTGRGVLVGDASGHTRISMIINHGIGHAWASGKGTSLPVSSDGFDFLPVGFLPGNDSYVNPNSVDYPLYLLGFLSSQSLRP